MSCDLKMPIVKAETCQYNNKNIINYLCFDLNKKKPPPQLHIHHNGDDASKVIAYFLNSVCKYPFLMEMQRIFFEVGSEYLNIII